MADTLPLPELTSGQTIQIFILYKFHTHECLFAQFLLMPSVFCFNVYNFSQITSKEEDQD